MSLVDQINDDIKTAMKAREKEKLSALRAIKAAFIVEATKEGGDGAVSDEAAATIVQKLYKQRRDAAKIYVEQNRADLEEVETFEANVIEAYLPAQMSEEEVRAVVAKAIANVGASGPQDMGKVMGPVMGQLKGKADGSLISKLVKELLAS